MPHTNRNPHPKSQGKPNGGPQGPLKVLVTGATGYVGSRLVPQLLDQGHRVVAASRSEDGVDDYPWAAQVEVRRFDVQDEDLVTAAVQGIDAVVYLVHSMASRDFVEKDRAAAELMARACASAGVGRIVYLSGLVPDVGEDELSDHLRSRLEVEQVFLRADVSATVLRASMVIGAGSTSYELLRRLSERVPILMPVPAWMRSRIQPIAVEDVVTILGSALTASTTDRHYDVGGDEVLSYPELLATFAEVAGLRRVRVLVPFVPHWVVARACALISRLPAKEVGALVDSLEHDMICTEDDVRRDLLDPGFEFTGVEEALGRSLDPSRAPGTAQSGDIQSPAPTDPA